MTNRLNTANYATIFSTACPLLDVRAPAEFQKGAFPDAVSIPLLDDDERIQVGICYKQKGEQAAIALGNRLVSGPVKQRRIDAWRSFAEQHPNGYLYCFRGGLRSQTVQSWLKEAGVDIPLVEGGYKAMRRFLMEETERLCAKRSFIIIGGRTGSGKTNVLNQLPHMVDLEKLANHKGSSFGRSVDDFQPTQISFENALACDLMKVASGSSSTIVLEDESLMIGRIALPNAVLEVIQSAPMVLVDEPLDMRVRTIKQDYVVDLHAAFVEKWGDDQGMEAYSAFMLASLDRVKRRLGGERHMIIRSLMEKALSQHQRNGNHDVHSAWIGKLLSDYYDPMYDYQLSKKEQDIKFKGSGADVCAFLKNAT